MSQVIDISVEIAKIKNLPTLPEESLRIINAINDPDISINKLVEIITLSPTLTARLLGLANSAYFSRTIAIKDLRIAIIQVLGLNLVKSLALSIALNIELDTSKCKLFDSGFFWSHALITANLAQKLSSHVDNELISSNTVYTSGLLLNIGLVAAVHIEPERVNDVLAKSDKTDGSVTTHMKEEFGLTQYDLAGVLLGRWKLPELYQTIIKEFKTPSFSGKERVIIDLLRLSHCIGYYVVTDKHEEMPGFSTYLDKLSISKKALDSSVLEIVKNKDNIKELATIIGE